MFKWQKTSEKNIHEFWSENTLLISFNNQKSELITNLKQKSLKGLFYKDNYIECHVGFEGENSEKSFLILDSKSTKLPDFEKRFLVFRALKKIKSKINFSNLLFYESRLLSVENSIYYEDLYSSTLGTFLKKSSIEKITALYNESINPEIDLKDKRYYYNLQYRQWINENPDELTSIEIGKRLEDFSKKHHIEFNALDIPRLEKENMNLLLAVGQGSSRSPSRLFTLNYNPEKSTEKPIMLVGKGITFDTGGLNVKPFESFVNCMKNDMGGAGLFANLFMALVENKVKRPICLVIAACENLVSEKAMKPGAIIKSRSGNDVIVEHTDCEGRLILADALHYGNEKFNPCQTFVAATLTTAALRQFSGYYTPVYFADTSFKDRLLENSNKWLENFVFWDEFIPFREANLSNAGTFTNLGRVKGAIPMAVGSNVAAHFLKEFCSSPMVHFDIFATTWNWTTDYPGASYGGTGSVFNSLYGALST